MTNEEVAALSGIRLDIGCGANKQNGINGGWVGLDARPLPGVDIVHNVEVTPWPLPDDCVLCAVASHLVEHINPAGGGFLRFMDEVWRVLKVGGEFAIVMPHGRSDGFLQDPTHCNPRNEVTWAYFDPEEHVAGGQLWRIYQPKPWQIKVLTWSPAGNMEVVLVKRAIEERWYA
jgi:SAM-dependent methyltransferase